MSTWPKASTGGRSGQRSVWPKVWPNVNLNWSVIEGYTWPKESQIQRLTKCQPDLKHHWGYIWLQVSLTQSLTKCQPDPKPHLGVHLTEGEPDLKTDQMSTWLKASLWGVHLTKGEPDLKTYQMSTWPKASLWWYIWLNESQTWRLTKCQPDPKHHCGGYIWLKVSLMQSVTKCQPDLKPHLRVYIWPQEGLTWTDQMPIWPKVSSWEVHLTTGQPDPKWQNVNLTWSLIWRRGWTCPQERNLLEMLQNILKYISLSIPPKNFQKVNF